MWAGHVTVACVCLVRRSQQGGGEDAADVRRVFFH